MSEKTPPFTPVVPAQKKLREFSLRAVVLGVLLGLLFGVGNAYLGLKIGSTISASIPAAVLSMAILRLIGKSVTILENNMVQTIAAVGEGLAAGVIFTVPALFFLGNHPSPGYIFVLAMLGGVLGVLFMIPMRRYIIVKEHGILPFPEGTACAEILKTGEKDRSGAILAGWGLLIGAIQKLCTSALFLWNEVATYTIRPFQSTQFSMDCTPALLGVGYIIGPRIASTMFAGGAIAWWVLIPLIKMFGQGVVTIYPAITPIAQMSAEMIWEDYIRYIGAGAVAFGGIMSLYRIFPIIIKTIHLGFTEVFAGAFKASHIQRTDRDIPLPYLICGSVAAIALLWAFFPMNLLTIVLLVILAFFFVAVTSITVGLVGSSSNPVSGMIITTLLITCLIFVSLGWTERIYLISAITMGCVASVAIALAGTTSQDLKTGYIVGATPRSQQIAEIIGLVLPAAAIGVTMYLLNKVYVLGSPAMPAPQASLMAMIAKGVISKQLPFTLVTIGIILGIAAELTNISVLPFALGLYLPLSLSSGIMVGGVVHAYVKRLYMKDSIQKGVLAASGLVAGDACMGVIVALLAVLGLVPASKVGFFNDAIALGVYAILAVALGYFATRFKNKKGV
ncbi:MAG: oligopeptide transporter, OPT family [Chlamydiales bacterium]|nr:oligopeptide transporter, OPT family [Chlamydiales bacterium]